MLCCMSLQLHSASHTLGRTALAKHHIETENARPVRLPPYRILQVYREAVQNEIHKMLEEGIIDPSKCEWSSPIIPDMKKDGSLCLCIN